VADAAAVNASPLILLSRAGELSLLQALDRRLVVPNAVMHEVRAKGDDDITARSLRETSWIEVVADAPVPESIAAWDLGSGESAVLAWALANAGTLAILDDREARRCAASVQVETLGTVGVVLKAKRIGRIDAASPVLQKLVAAGMYLAPSTLAEVLRRVGE